MVFKHLQSCGNLARTIRIGTLYFTISISTMSNACSYPSVRFPSRLVGWGTDLDCNVGLWASRADDVVSFASLSGPEATRACTFTHNPIASASSLFEHIHRVNISFTLLFSKTVFQFYNWPDVLANPAWPWNFLRMNSKRTKCSQLWAERVRISLASLSGSGGTGPQCMFTRLWVLRDSLNCWRQQHCYSASALTQHQLNCSVTLIKIWYQVSADSEAAIKLLEYTGNASFQCPLFQWMCVLTIRFLIFSACFEVANPAWLWKGTEAGLVWRENALFAIARISQDLCNEIGYIYSTFLHCVFPCVSLKCFPQMMLGPIGWICLQGFP